MNKLETIDAFLKNKADVYLGKTFIDDNFYNLKNGSIHKVEFLVAPNRPKKDVFDLEEFMLTLIPENLVPNGIKVFRKDDSSITYGYLVFDDIIGSVATTDIYVSDDSYIIKKLGGTGKILENNTIMNSYDLRRRIFIHPFPSKNILTNALNGKLGLYNITTDNLDKYIGK